MASVNKAILVGNLGRDPDKRFTAGGDPVTTINIATTDTWKDKSGEKQERTEWHRVVLFGRQAEIAGQYLKKGSPVYVEGSIRTRKWTDQQGQERYTTEIVGDRIQLLGTRGGPRDEPPPYDEVPDYAKREGGARAPREGDAGGRPQGGEAGATRQGENTPPPEESTAEFGDDIPF